MKYIVAWTLSTGDAYRAATERFLTSGGAPPEGVTMLGRWHGMNKQGFAVAETSDAKALYTWLAQWADVMDISVTPCLEDADAGAVLQAVRNS